MLGVSGTSGLPDHCLVLSATAFFCAILLNSLRDWGPPWLRSFLPIPTALAIPFYGEPLLPCPFRSSKISTLLYAELGLHAPALGPPTLLQIHYDRAGSLKQG